MKHEQYPDVHHDPFSKTVFGFWVYLMTDFMMFACLFATYVVLKDSTFGGPGSKELFDVHEAFIQSLLLFSASVAAGCASSAAHRKKQRGTVALFGLTFLLGFAFFWMQCQELVGHFQEGHIWKNSAFLSSYYTVIGTFALHLFFALLWTIVLVAPVPFRGIDLSTLTRLSCLKLFWQFLNIVWIFIFTAIYLMGGL